MNVLALTAGAARVAVATALFSAVSISQASPARPTGPGGEWVVLTLGGSAAGPSVEGDTISWPNDGWYQVQDAATYESLCQGGTSCTVDPGTYIVINHTTGRRYTDIVVGGSSGTESLVVEGQTIHWPDDGWYQVQNAATYESFCEGERACTVEPGTYIVINHTTGRRFEDVVVESDDGSGSTGSVSVDGSTIRWPDNGWYQVQNATTYESLCEGGTACTVAPGTYTVINLTTGERFAGIEVAGEGSGGVTVDGNTIRWPDDGWYQVQNAETFESLCEGGSSCMVGPGIYNVINLTVGTRSLVTVSYAELPKVVGDRLKIVFDVVNAEFAKMPVQVSRRMAAQYNDFFNREIFSVDDFSFGQKFGEGIYELSCMGGGTASGSIRTTTSPDEESFSFQACGIASLKLNGSSAGRRGTFLPNVFESYSYSDFSISDSILKEKSTFTGMFVRIENGTSYEIQSFELPGTEKSISIERADSQYDILSIDLQSANANAPLFDGSPGYTVQAEIAVGALGNAMKLATTEPLESDLTDGSRDTGSMVVSGPDFRYMINLNNGDTRTFEVLVEENESVTSYTVAWGAPFKLNKYDPSSVDVGF